jgi:formylglycine-generating enzyme required for sulfatase activity
MPKSLRIFLLLAMGLWILTSCSEDSTTAPELEEPDPIPAEKEEFEVRVEGWNYVALTWTHKDDSVHVPMVVEVRVAADSLDLADWADHPVGSNTVIRNLLADSLTVLIYNLQPAAPYVASWRLLYDDSTYSAIGPWTVFETSARPEPSALAEVPGGSFVMGSDPGEGSTWEIPETVLELETYYIERTEVTNAQYWRFMSEYGYQNSVYWSDEGWDWKTANEIEAPKGWETGTNRIGLLYPDHPVAGISWFEAEAYARWAGRRLPTEAEWEKAARGGCELSGGGDCDSGDERIYPWGADSTYRSLNLYHSGDPYEPGTTPVGFFDGRAAGGFQTADGASPYGLYDMAGNVSEWTASRRLGYPYVPDDGREAAPFTGTSMAVRGGSWVKYASECRISYRSAIDSDDRNLFNGFRCAASQP